MKKYIKNFMKDNRGVGVVEMVLIILVLVGLVVLFKTQASTLIGNIFKIITTKVSLM